MFLPIIKILCFSSGPWKKKNLTEYGIVTQCMAPVRQPNDQYLTNCLLKINAKVIFFLSLYQSFICFLCTDAYNSTAWRPEFHAECWAHPCVYGDLEGSNHHPWDGCLTWISWTVWCPVHCCCNICTLYSSLYICLLFCFVRFFLKLIFSLSCLWFYIGGEFKAVASSLEIQSICSHTAFKSWDDWVTGQEEWNRRWWHNQVLNTNSLCFFSLFSYFLKYLIAISFVDCRELLVDFYTSSGKRKPEHIIIFR